MKLKWVLFLLFLNISFVVFSQKETITLEKSVDSILTTKPTTYKEIDKILKKFQRDSTKVKMIIEKFNSVTYYDGLTYEYIKLGNIYRKYSRYNKAIETHEKALANAVKSNNPEFKIFSLNMLGVDYRKKNFYTYAINYNKEALEIAEKIKNPNSGILRSMEVSYNSIGNIYLLLEQYLLAENSFKKALEIAKKSKNKWSVSINNENIARIKEAQDSLDLAITYTNNALVIDENINNHYGRMICYNSLGRLHIKKGDYRTAATYLNKAVPIAQSVKNNFYIANINNNLGWLNTKIGNISLAKNYFKKSLEIAEENNYKTALVEIYTNFSEYNEFIGNYREALKYQKKQTTIRSQLLNDKTTKYVNDLIVKYDSERKTNEIKNLAKQNEIVQLKLAKNRNFIIIGFIIILLIATLFYFLYRQHVLNNEKKILTLEQDVLRNQMNPHFIFNALNSIKHYIVNNEQKNAVHYLNKFSKLIRRILEASSIKETSLQEELETMDLYMTIENIRFSNEINFQIKVSEDVNLESIKVPPLVMQPFLENAIWHGLSSKKDDKKVQISIVETEKGYIEIRIKDNGVGREVSAQIKAKKSIKRKSLGVELTKARLKNFVKNLQKDYAITYYDLKEGNNSLGTEVVIKIPLF